MKSLINNSDKPFFFTLMAGELADTGMDVFKEASVPVYSYPETSGLIANYKYRQRKSQTFTEEYSHVSYPASAGVCFLAFATL